MDMEFVAVIGVIIAGVLMWLRGKKGRDSKKFWSGVKAAIAEAQVQEEELNEPILELEDDLIDVEVELEDVEDAHITVREAIDLLREQFGWDGLTPPSDDK